MRAHLRPSRRLHGIVISLALAFPLAALAQGVDAVVRARALIGEKDAAGAYAILAPLEMQRAADNEFNYWLGVAAFESARLERAAIAFERALVRNPEFDSARLELGRTYLRMGSLDLAEREFELLAERTKTPEGTQAITAYLEEIRRLKARRRFAATAHAELGGGRDTNITATTRDFTSAVSSGFGLPGVGASGNSIRRADEFVSLEAGGDVFYRPREDRALFGGVSVRARDYRQFREFNYRLFDANAGVQSKSGENGYFAAVFAQEFRQDGAFDDPLLGRVTNNRRGAGAQFEARRSLGSGTQAALGVQASALRYRDNPAQDSNQVQMSLALQHAPGWWRNATLVGVVYLTSDDALRPINQFASATSSHNTYGLRLSAYSDARLTFSWLAVAGVSRRLDDDAFARATLVQTGRDDLAEAYLRATWRLDPRWSVNGWGSYLYSRSNIGLYSFRKAEGGISVRFDYQ